MLIHIYPLTPQRNIEVTICKYTRLTAHFMCGLMSDLVICKFKKSMVIHDTKCPYWDQVSLNNTIQSRAYDSCLSQAYSVIVWYMLAIIMHFYDASMKFGTIVHLNISRLVHCLNAKVHRVRLIQGLWERVRNWPCKPVPKCSDKFNVQLYQISCFFV